MKAFQMRRNTKVFSQSDFLKVALKKQWDDRYKIYSKKNNKKICPSTCLQNLEVSDTGAVF